MNVYTKFYELLEAANIVYTPEEEKNIIRKIGDLMEAAGIKPKEIRYLFNYSEDFLPDTLSMLPKK
jgi:hypothetical protein